MSETNLSRGLLSKFTFFNKLKSIKHFDLVVALILGAIVLAIYFGSFSSSSSGTSTISTQISYTNASTYASELESKLENIISKIKGVSDVEAMVVLASSSELVIAKNITETSKNETDKNGVVSANTTKEESPLVISQGGKNDPLILVEILPKVAGVVVVAKGANDVNTKLNILKAIQALFDVPSGNIEIIEGG